MEKLIEWVSYIAAISEGSILGAAISWILGLGAILMIVLEFMPIVKLHPITFMLKWIGDKVNKEVMTEVGVLKETVDNIQEENAWRYAITCRTRILRFGDEIRQGSKHSKESFDQILDDIDYYDKYCQEHPDFKNNKTHLTTKKIMETYTKCMDLNDFL